MLDTNLYQDYWWFAQRYGILNIVLFISSMCKVLENRAQQDEERMDQLTNQLKEARLLAEDADGKSDEVRLETLTTLTYDHFF